MYKSKCFKTMKNLIDWMNEQKINERLVVSIVPDISWREGDVLFETEYQIIYREQKGSTLI